jgi:hypothetical protein
MKTMHANLLIQNVLFTLPSAPAHQDVLALMHRRYGVNLSAN